MIVSDEVIWMSYEEYLRIIDAIKNCPMTIKENIAIANFIAGLVEE
tara:strand:+ start:1000 stop:1137 length:138 start_codon:yes stop_codon:yes gene_type:complete